MKPVLLPADYLSGCFSSSYIEASRRFEYLARTQGGDSRYIEYNYRGYGPAQERLVTAILWQGSPDARRVLVLQSATHGVEGFAGSAIQLDSLNKIMFENPDVAVLYIHAINPHGFAWLRRVDEQGIDLNRNYVDFTKPLPVNVEYQKLAGSLLPANETEWDSATQSLQKYRDEFGQQALELAITAGQYSFEDGLFYGGQAPSQSRLNLEKIITEFQLDERERVVVIDVHTGLGPFGYGELICDHPPGTQGVNWARKCFGDSVTEPALGTSSSVPKMGLIDYMWHQRLGERVSFVTLEFGTYSVDNMIEVLRRDHMLHHSRVEWSGENTQQIKQSIKKFFYPATPDWQEMVLLRGRQVVNQAMQSLSATV